ncbi:Sas10 C-terminal domain-containing protein [Sphaerosporella brunnea]|uniref:Sas10 C-terminal domain-containing protein n=1 Tax=Sphaerosporella brunnea TaxID=1250544 RepID=A0A5J5F9D8_9PEZI|nr:Sas10 C-terminal domain-containing protein [Sphaerosporella brunnea]
MARKRRSTTTSRAGPREVNPKDAKISAINTWADVADEEDEFHLQRDQVALETLSGGRGRRDAEEAEEFTDEEEVMGLGEYGYNDPEEADEEEEDEEADDAVGKKGGDDSSDEEPENEEEAEEGWGSSRKNYYQDAEEEVDAAEEEAEALRIQSKQIARMSAGDFAFDDDDWTAPTTTTIALTLSKSTTVTETLATKLPDAPEDRLKLLHTRHPEFAPLTQEFLALQNLFPALEMSAMAATTVGETEKSSAVVRKWKVASAYLGVLSMYFAILTDAGKEDDGGIDRVREHPIMSALLGVRQAWEKVKDERVERIEARLERIEEASENISGDKGRKRKLDSEDDSDSEGSGSDVSDSAVQVVKKLRATTTKEDFTDLDGLTAFPSKTTKKVKAKPANADDDFGEESVLNAIDAEEKLKRKRNLRFYTAQINQKSSKRDAASRGAGGDVDIPHRERRKERELRLRAEAQRQRDLGVGADLSDGEPDSPPPSAKKSAAPADDPDNEYYELLAATSKKRKEDKLALHEAQKAAKKEGKMLQITHGAVGADGKREIGWTIMKNKGLKPHRKKEVRNPRVKKKMQYDKKMKKLSSVKAVYKGGQQGAYGGEATGIKKNIVKSTKFRS